MFYVTCCFVTFFRVDRDTPEPRRFRLVGIQGGTLLVALAAAAIATRYMAEPTQRTSLTHEPYAKLVWFLGEPLVNAGSLFQITPSYATVALVGSVIVIGSAAFLWRRGVFGTLCLLWGLMLLPLAYLPNLLTAESWASYRSIGPLSAMILVLVAWAALGIARLGFRSPRVPATALIVGLAFWSCVAARTTVLNHIVSEQIAERDLFRAQLLKAAGQDVAAVHIIQARYEFWPTRTYRYEDFGVLSSCADWCPEPMFRLMSAELPDPLAHRLAGLPVTWGLEPKEGDDSGLLQIDMRLLREYNAEHL
jgi:hypothetical protein